MIMSSINYHKMIKIVAWEEKDGKDKNLQIILDCGELVKVCRKKN